MQEKKKVLLLGQAQQAKKMLIEAEWEIENLSPVGGHLNIKEVSEQAFDVAVLELYSEENLLLLQNIKKNTKIPVLGIVKESGDVYLTEALEQGMEDFMVSPMNSWEFQMRMKNLIKRCRAGKSNLCQMKSFSLDKVRRKVFLKSDGEGENMIELSHTEYMLLSMFVENENVLLTYKDLYKKVWDTDSLDDVRTVKVHVSNLRKKIDPQDIGIIANVRRAGYIFSDL